MKIVPIILLTLFNLIACNNYCDNKYCNYHGLCTVDGGGHIKCECVENVYDGEKCENVIKYCNQNYCENINSCRDYPGGYNCDCEENYGGQNCTQRSNQAYKNPLIFYNLVIRVNVEEYFIVFFEVLPVLDLKLELTTFNYMMESFQFSREENKVFRKTSNIRKIAKRYEILEYKAVDEIGGYYIAIKYSVPKLMTYKFCLIFISLPNNNELYFWEFGVRAYEPELKCIPDIENYDCTNPKEPMSITIDLQYAIAPIIKRNCGQNSKLTFSWIVSDYFDRKVLHVFKEYTRRQLNLLPFTMHFNDKSDEFHSFYVIKVYVNEENRGAGKSKGQSYFRCYVQTTMPPPLADIKGGIKRQVGIDNKITLNGAQSRDLSQPDTQTIEQTLRFMWICESIDEPSHKYCSEFRGTQPIVTIPSNTLTITKSYNFTLTVKSRTTNKSNSKSQTITITSKDQTHLELDVICLKNCKTPVGTDTELFLKGECNNCNDRNAVQYKWELEDKIVGNRNRLTLAANHLSKNVNYVIRLQADLNDAHGEYYYEFKTNAAIGTGYCDIEPNKDGQALTTIYNITCNDFTSDYQPLEYKVYTTDRIVAASFNSRFGFRLRNNENSLIVKVFDRYGELVTTDLNVDSKPIEINSLDAYDWLVRDNDVQGIAVMIECQIINLDKIAGNKDDAIMYMLNALKNIEYSPTTFDMELGTNTLVKLLNAFEMDYDKALVLFDVLENYLTILREFSYIDAILVTRDFIEILNTNYINIMDKLYTEFVTIPEESHQMYENDAVELELYDDENYAEYPVLDFEAVSKILQLEQIFNTTKKLNPILNRILSKRLEVNETPVFYENDMNIMKSYSVCNDDPAIDESLKFSFPKFDIKLNDIIFDLNTELTINLKYFKKPHATPFWWLPQSEKEFTTIFMMQLNERSTWNKVPNLNRPILNYHYKSESGRRRRRAPPDIHLIEIGNVIYNKSDIVVYTLKYNKNELILINFKSSVPNRLQLAFKRNAEPNYIDFHNANPLYIVEQTERIIRLQYDQSFTLFMGVILADDDDPITNVKFGFTIESIACTNFDFVTQKWCSNNCQIAFNSTKTDIKCSCINQNANLYSTYDKPKTVYYYNRYNRLFLRELPINFTIVIILLILIILFICLLLLIILKSMYDRKTARAVSNNVIGTNNPADHNYLLTIVCGSSSVRHKVTTSNIGLQIYGDRRTSDQYIFNLTAAYNNPDDPNIYQFMIRSNYDLGDIQSLLIWIDYTGASPSFECDEIIISYYERTYRFNVYDRLSLQYSNSNIIKLININERNEITFLKLLQRIYFKNNLLINFYRNKMYLTRLFLRIVVIMLVCLLLMGRTTFENYKKYNAVQISYLNIFICILIVVVIEKLLYYIYVKYMQV